MICLVCVQYMWHRMQIMQELSSGKWQWISDSDCCECYSHGPLTTHTHTGSEICYSQETVIRSVVKHAPPLSQSTAVCQWTWTVPHHIPDVITSWLAPHPLAAQVNTCWSCCEARVTDVKTVPVKRHLTPQLSTHCLHFSLLQHHQLHHHQPNSALLKPSSWRLHINPNSNLINVMAVLRDWC